MRQLAAWSMVLLAGCSGPEPLPPPPPADEIARVAPARRTSRSEGRDMSLCAADELDLFRGAKKGDVAIVRACLEANLDPNAVDEDGMSVLALAAESGEVEVIRLLLEAGAELEGKGRVSPLGQALRHRREAAARALLEAGATANVELLIEAIQLGEAGIAQALMDHGADPDGVSRMGVTPLLAATAQCDEDLVTTLLGAGADPDRASLAGRPIDVARSRGEACTTVTRLLEGVLGPRVGGYRRGLEPGPDQPGGWRPSRPPEVPSVPRRPPV